MRQIAHVHKTSGVMKKDSNRQQHAPAPRTHPNADCPGVDSRAVVDADGQCISISSTRKAGISAKPINSRPRQDEELLVACHEMLAANTQVVKTNLIDQNHCEELTTSHWNAPCPKHALHGGRGFQKSRHSEQRLRRW